MKRKNFKIVSSSNQEVKLATCDSSRELAEVSLNNETKKDEINNYINKQRKIDMEEGDSSKKLELANLVKVQRSKSNYSTPYIFTCKKISPEKNGGVKLNQFHLKNFKNNKILSQFGNLTWGQRNSSQDNNEKINENIQKDIPSYEYDNYSLKSKSHQSNLNQTQKKVRNFSSTSCFNNDKEILISKNPTNQNNQKFSNEYKKEQLYKVFTAMNILILETNEEEKLSNLERIKKILRIFHSTLSQIQDTGICEVINFLKDIIGKTFKNQNDDLMSKLKEIKQKLTEMEKQNRSLTLNNNFLNEKKLDIEEKCKKLEYDFKKLENKYKEESKAF